MAETLDIRLSGASVLVDRVFRREPVTIGDGFLGGDGGREVDLTGYLVLPGIVDVHGDGFERHLAPRRGAALDKAEALFHVEAELAANGITTACLAQFWSWEGGMRGPDFAAAVARAVASHRGLVDLRLQLRVETSLTDD
ncbi:MAG: alpha-D-ribose 1-methylphosphonate 5-triphosphate diphosphatase, partial [Rubricella sp.]